jgi:hypothetical protein
MPLVNLSITYVYDFHADEKPFEYNVRFTVALLRCAAPQILKCAWEEIVVFPSLESATNPQFQGIRLMDIAEIARSHDLVENLAASGFSVDDDSRVTHLWAPKTSICIHISQAPQTPEPDSPWTPMETHLQRDTNDEDRISKRKMIREHISNSQKKETKQLVIEMFPRDSDGVILSESSDIPSLRRPPWVMDELHRSLAINMSRDDAAKGLKFAIAYAKRERRR